MEPRQGGASGEEEETEGREKRKAPSVKPGRAPSSSQQPRVFPGLRAAATLPEVTFLYFCFHEVTRPAHITYLGEHTSLLGRRRCLQLRTALTPRTRPGPRVRTAAGTPSREGAALQLSTPLTRRGSRARGVLSGQEPGIPRAGGTPSLELGAPPHPQPGRTAGAPPLGEAQARARAPGRSALT